MFLLTFSLLVRNGLDLVYFVKRFVDLEIEANAPSHIQISDGGNNRGAVWVMTENVKYETVMKS